MGKLENFKISKKNLKFLFEKTKTKKNQVNFYDFVRGFQKHITSQKL